MRRFFLASIYILSFTIFGIAQHDHSHGDGHNHDHGTEHAHGDDHGGHHATVICGEEVDHTFNAGDNAIHHISDANVYSIGPLQIPLPCMLYAPEKGWDVFMSSKFHADLIGHGDGHNAYNGYVLDGGSVKRVVDGGFPDGEVAISGIVHKKIDVDGKKKETAFVCYNNKLYKTDLKSTADAGLFGGGLTSFYDFSLTKNVTSMILVLGFLFWLLTSAARLAKKNEGKAPTGVQNFVEPMVTFIRDEVAIPFLGDKYEKFLPFLLTIFFFILGLNLFGQVPFFGGSNVTGNLSVTLVLAVIAFIVTNINGNKDYWMHLFTAPGTPWFVKIILVPVELLGMLLKPVTLMLRLFANITAGHIVILIFVSLIFIFGKSGESIPGTGLGLIAAGALSLFMMAIELIVALVQAFVFTILTASYIGAATEEHHHEEHAH